MQPLEQQVVMWVILCMLVLVNGYYQHIQQLELNITRRQRVFAETFRGNCIYKGRQFLGMARTLPYGPYRSRRNRRMWTKCRSTDWWERIVLKEFTDEEWVENFRMTRKTFDELCNSLRGSLSTNTNHVRTPISVEKKVAVALYKFGSCCEYRVVGNQFGIHKSSVHNIVYSFCKAIIKVLGKTHIYMPNDVECFDLSHQFEKKCGIPQIIGAIDGTHVPILPPSVGLRDFVNRKGWASYNVQAVVDVYYRFRDVTCKHPGSTHDSVVLRDSFLFKNADDIIPQSERIIDGKQIPFMILGDPAYPLLSWLLKGFRSRAQPAVDEESFNAYLSQGRIVVENAFGRLKGRWRCLLKRNDISYKFIPKVVIACCILHNIVETKKEEFLNVWLNNVREAELLYPQPINVGTRDADGFQASEIRDTLKEYLARNFPTLQSRFR